MHISIIIFYNITMRALGRIACVIIIIVAQLARADPNVFRYFYFFLLKWVPPIYVCERVMLMVYTYIIYSSVYFKIIYVNIVYIIIRASSVHHEDGIFFFPTCTAALPPGEVNWYLTFFGPTINIVVDTAATTKIKTLIIINNYKHTRAATE